MLPFFLFFIVFFSCVDAQAKPGEITTLVGVSDPQLRAMSKDYQVRGIAYDQEGNLYILDGLYHRVLKYDVEGQLSLVAGNGSQGYSGDGLQANKMTLSMPLSIDFDRQNQMYIVDFANRRVLKRDLANDVYAVAVKGYTELINAWNAKTANDIKWRAVLSIVVDDEDNLYATLYGGGCTYFVKVDAEGNDQVLASFHSRDEGQCSVSGLFNMQGFVMGLALDGYGQVYISSEKQVLMWDKKNHLSVVAGVAGRGYRKEPRTLNTPLGKAVETDLGYLAG